MQVQQYKNRKKKHLSLREFINNLNRNLTKKVV